MKTKKNLGHSKLLVILVLALIIGSTNAYGGSHSESGDTDIYFQDISGNEWYSAYVSKMVTWKLVSGYPDQTFRPNNEITVAEFIKITVEILSYYPEKESGKWFDPYVSKAIELGLIGENEFTDYNRPINREEMSKIIVNAIDEEPQSGELNFSDAAQIEDQYVPYIKTAVQLGIIQGYPDNSFGANRMTTRAEASAIFVLLIEDIIDIKPFDEDDALALESEFERRLFQETEGDSWVVEDYDNIENLIDYISEIANRNLAETYVNNYYEYMDGELVIPPKGGPTLILENRDYQLEMTHPREYRLTQETTTEMVGHYTLTITYYYKNDDWIMEDRNIEVH